MAKKYGVKIKNPLPLAVSVRIKSPTGVHMGDGKETCLTIKPGATLYIPTKGRCEVDIDPSVIRYDEVGQPVNLGDAAFGWLEKPASGKKVTQQKKRKKPEPELRSLGDMIEDMRKKEEVIKV